MTHRLMHPAQPAYTLFMAIMRGYKKSPGDILIRRIFVITGCYIDMIVPEIRYSWVGKESRNHLACLKTSCLTLKKHAE